MGDTYTSWKPTSERPRIPRGIGFAKRPESPDGSQWKGGLGGSEGVRRDVLDAVYLQDALLGKRIGIPHGSVSEAGLFFHGPPDQTPQDPRGTGLYWPGSDAIGMAVAGAAEVLIDAVKILMTHDIWFKSGTAFNGKMEHAITADRTWTFPDASGTIALTTGTTPVERKESHVVLFLEYPEHTC